MWDVFISHASEDKNEIVKELVRELQKAELSVWHDEFELKVGDSLSRSIDKGLSKSRFGIVILSKYFFEKGWTEYELRSLLTREVNNKSKVILPIWHEISYKEISEYSLFLADKYALSTDLGLDEVVYKIVEAVKPDLINSNALLHASRELVGKGERVKINDIDLYDNEIRHKKLPNHLIIATKLISSIFYDILKFDYKDYVIDFAKDGDYDHEFMLWCAMASTYIEFINNKKINVDDLNLKKDVFAFLLGIIMGEAENVEEYCDNHKKFTLEECKELLFRFAVHHDSLFEFFDESMEEKYKRMLKPKDWKDNMK